MKTPHLLIVEEGPERFAALFASARELGLRLGWLDLLAAAPPSPLPPDLEAAAGEGALRAVAVGGGRSVVVKPLRGEPVLADLLREHFRGCAAVLVRGVEGGAGALGAVEAPRLTLEGESWKVAPPGEAARLYPAAAASDLVAALRRPRPWGG
jgi:hypothetical protein